jgi:hypothetical protein
MPNLPNPFSTYSDVTPQKRVITDYITLIDPSDAPYVERVGGLDGAAGKFKFLNKGVRPEWLEDTLSPLSGILANSATIASTDTTMTVADPNMLQKGHILLIGSEQVWISAISGSVVTVTRAFNGTAASANSIAAFTVVGIARLEGADSDELGYTDRTTGSNFTQIFHQEIKVTETQQVIDQYGISNEFDYQAKKAVPSLMRLIERQTVYGVAKSGSTTTPRSFAGTPAFVTTNKIAGTSLAQSMFENAVKAAYEAGGTGPWVAVCSPNNLQKIKNFYDSSNFLRVTTEQSRVGMVIETIVTPFGDVDLLLNRWQTNTEIPIVDAQHAGYLTLRPFTQEPLAKVGDSIRGQVVGEFTYCLRQEKAHAILTAVS